MLHGYITRGTTIHGKSVNEGEIHEMDDAEFRTLKLAGFVRLLTAEEAAKLTRGAAKPETKKEK